MSVESVLEIGTGLAWLAPGMPRGTLWRTALLIQVCHAFVCAVLARGAARPAFRWFVAGLCFGSLALVALLVGPLRSRR